MKCFGFYIVVNEYLWIRVLDVCYLTFIGRPLYGDNVLRLTTPAPIYFVDTKIHFHV